MAESNENPFSDRILGYCTNVHAGATLIELIGNLAAFATKVRQRYCPDRDLPIGLWLMAEVVASMRQTGQTMDLIEFFWDHHLVPYTINGFPYGCFHDPVVKHQVYIPNWLDDRRSDYTTRLPLALQGLDVLGGGTKRLHTAHRMEDGHFG